jgi:hypothetical protein
VIDPGTELLIQRSLDGDLSPEEEARLEVLLEGSPEARTYRERLTTVVAGMESATPDMAPLLLKERILEHLRVPEPVSPGARLRSWWNALAGPNRYRTGFVFATGAAAGALLLALWGPDQESAFRERGAVSGTMIPAESPAGFTEAARTPLTLPGLEGTARVTVSGTQVLLDLRLETPEPGTVTVAFPGEVRGLGVRDLEGGGPATIEEAALRVDVHGRRRVTALFTALPGERTLTLTAGRPGSSAPTQTVTFTVPDR